MKKTQVTLSSFQPSLEEQPRLKTPQPWLDEHDSCAIVASVRKTGEATHGTLKRALEALSKMGHRSGDINGEGDGCGVLTDIPRRLWAEALDEVGKPSWLAEDRRFFVGHLMIPVWMNRQTRELQQAVVRLIGEAGADLLLERQANTRPLALGRMGRSQAPLFWQIAGLMSECSLGEVERCLFDLTLRIEQHTGIHVASLSSYSVIYKVRGSIETLYQYYPELRSPDFTTAISLGHARYSTNTATAFERVQPFSLLGHNGEINTIARLREQAQMLGVQLVEGGSDSQDLDRTMATLIHHYGFTLAEAMEIIFPPILSEMDKLRPDLQSIYHYYRQAFGPFAQGPAAIISRYGDECVFSVDAMGLRPLWFGETEKEYFFSSEKGVYHLDGMRGDPRPFSPGEKMSVDLCRNSGVELFDYPSMQHKIKGLSAARLGTLRSFATGRAPGERAVEIVNTSPEATEVGSDGSLAPILEKQAVEPNLLYERAMAAFGWGREDREWVQSLAETGHDPISSIGFDGPLAALSDQRQNLSDYYKEAVAVVTNPSVDREREVEHFSTQCILGPRPSLSPDSVRLEPTLALDCPILIDGHPDLSRFLEPECRKIAHQSGALTLAELLLAFDPDAVTRLETVTLPGESVELALERLAESAVAAASSGASLILLDDRTAFTEGRGWIDPHLAIAAVDRALRTHRTAVEIPAGLIPSYSSLPLSRGAGGDYSPRRPSRSSSPFKGAGGDSSSLRRSTSLVLRSAAIRNLHDLIMALGLGADAVAPYLLFDTALGDPGAQLEPQESSRRTANTLAALQMGLEKVISTMGIHELRGYGRLFASIGLSREVADRMGTINYAGAQARGLGWTDLDRDVASRRAVFNGETRPQLSRVNHLYPKIWKVAGQVARGDIPRLVYEDQVRELTSSQPAALRHVVDFRYPAGGTAKISPDQVDAGLTGHSLPFVIASMSFGSQGENAFRAYAQAAYWLNIIALNGEGGEIQDMLGKYPHNRGQQIASGRFGVNAELINSSNLLEIKIGQGAKPGEGGHLPGRKVSAKVAAARHAQRGVDLISPSNNHDIYSIEDLAQFIEELKTANPKARVAVKVPVVPGIGIIAVGIAKAGADIINLSGYDGGTGAARQHSLRYVGLPAEIGVIEAHHALTQSGLRRRVELWCDGGMKTAEDVLKMICLGANRVGFGTLAMVAIGCTICRDCQSGTCHVGITTQIESVEEAQELGLRRFVPRDPGHAVESLVNLFGALGEGLRELTARLGFERTQDLVGRSDLLVQASCFERLDLEDLLSPAEEAVNIGPFLAQAASRDGLGGVPLRRPRNHLTTVISNLVMETLATGEEQVSFEDDKVSPVDRALGTHLTGAFTRYSHDWMWPPGHGGVGGDQESWRTPLNGCNGNGKHMREATLRFYASSVPGNGLGAYNVHPIHIVVEGGAQDGVAKGMQGGKVTILKGYNHDGKLIDGSVGKGLAYGATGGVIIVQGDADSRACVRLSGADVIIGGEIHQSLDDRLGFIGVRSNVKGFLCEYMTAGRVLVLGDPGPWICAGMTGGVLYLRLQPGLYFDREAIRRRIARGARVVLSDVDHQDQANLHELLSVYSEELARNHLKREAALVLDLLKDWQRIFVKIEPLRRQLNQAVSTE